MRSLALLLALIGVSAAATIYGMNGQQLQDAMMEAFASDPSSMSAAMGFGTLMGHQSDEPAPEAHADDEGAAEREARGTEDKFPAHEHNPFGPMMGMMFPEMMFPSYDAPASPVAANGHNGQAQSDSNGHSVPANGNGHSKPANGNGAPYAANGNGNVQAPVISSNGNGYHTPANGNGFQKPSNGNGYARPPNGNGRPSNGNGGAAASAVSISRGPNSYSTSHAQAFHF